MYENIYLEYNIDVNKLTRDYLKFPLQKITKKEYEKIPKEDLEYLYIKCNLPINVLKQYFNVSKDYIYSLGKIYHIKKSPKQIYENTKKTNLEKFGVECSLQSPIVREKIKQTNLQNFGVEYYSQTDEYKEKYKQTCLDHFGVENYSQTDEYKEKYKQTCLDHFGVENSFQAEICKEKIKRTNLERYGVENISQSDECKEKKKQTNLERYGVEWYTQSDEYKEKSKQTYLKHYGVENYSQSDEFKNLFKDKEFVNQVNEKRHETKKKNGSFGKSGEEDKIYDILLTKFKEVIRQYKSDLYPFRCDFYIPEIDLYIEYQGYFQHGFEPYLGTDKQKEIIKFWESESIKKPQYLRAIKTWTISDPLKRTTAKENNLNWIEFFNMKEFTQWFENIMY